MSPAESQHLIRDPFLPWDGPFPYDRLSEFLRAVGHAGLGPNSTAAEVNDALFDLMMVEAEGFHEVWDEVSNLDRRLLLDFCHYPLRGTAQPAGDSSEESPLPVSLDALRQLAERPPVLSWPVLEALPAEDTADTAVAPPRAISVSVKRLAVGPLDIGPVWSEQDFWEELP